MYKKTATYLSILGIIALISVITYGAITHYVNSDHMIKIKAKLEKKLRLTKYKYTYAFKGQFHAGYAPKFNNLKLGDCFYLSHSITHGNVVHSDKSTEPINCECQKFQIAPYVVTDDNSIDISETKIELYSLLNYKSKMKTEFKDSAYLYYDSLYLLRFVNPNAKTKEIYIDLTNVPDSLRVYQYVHQSPVSLIPNNATTPTRYYGYFDKKAIDFRRISF